ncbi:hypothetical protein [Mycolicibacterium setense]
MTDRIETVIAEHRPYGLDCKCGRPINSDADWAWHLKAELHAARIAVVELPEPDSTAQDGSRYVAGWDLNEYDAVKVDCFNRVMGVMDDEYSPQEAREYAAALLSAADAAEASQ